MAHLQKQKENKVNGIEDDLKEDVFQEAWKVRHNNKKISSFHDIM